MDELDQQIPERFLVLSPMVSLLIGIWSARSDHVGKLPAKPSRARFLEDQNGLPVRLDLPMSLAMRATEFLGDSNIMLALGGACDSYPRGDLDPWPFSRGDGYAP